MTVTLEDFAQLLDDVALEMAHALTPKADDPDRERRTWVLGCAISAVMQLATRNRWIAATARRPGEFIALPPAGARLS